MKYLLAIAAIGLAGCTSFEPLRPDLAARSAPSRLDEIAYINGLREAFDLRGDPASGCYDGANLQYFRPKLEQGYQEHSPEQENLLDTKKCVKFKEDPDNNAIRHYLESGFGLTDLYCQRYFVIAAESTRKRQFGRDMGSAGDALVNAVLTAASVGSIPLSIANSSFEAYDQTYQNIDTAFLVTPELDNIRRLVHAEQDSFRKGVFKDQPATFQGARSRIERYAGLCSFVGMQQLVNKSISSTAAAVEESVEGGDASSDEDLAITEVVEQTIDQ